MRRQRETCPQIFQRGNGFQAFLRVGGHRFWMRCHQPCVSLVMRAPNATAQLVKLRQTEVIRTFNDDRVRRRNIDAGFNNRRTHQHVKTLVVEIVHHPFQLALAHLPVTDGNACLRHQFSQFIGGFLDVFDIVKEIINLPAT
ncbi:hypothetical protein D3C78_1301880 [compost metagenome]